MQNNHVLNKICKKKSVATFYSRDSRHASAAWKHQAREIRRAYYRADRQLTRHELKLLARGNPWHDEIQALEALEVEELMDDFRYFENAERDWHEYEDWNEFEKETNRDHYREHYPDTRGDDWADWDDEASYAYYHRESTCP